MTPEEEASRTVASLKLKVRDYVYASGDTLQEFEKRIFYAKWFEQVGRKLRLNMGALFKCLEAIETEPAEFFRQVLEDEAAVPNSHPQESVLVSDDSVTQRAQTMAWAAANFLVALSKPGTPRRTLLGWRSRAAKTRLSALLGAARRAGFDEVQYLVEALAGFTACGEDVARIAAKLLGTDRERLTPEVTKALQGLHLALDSQVRPPVEASAPTKDMPERFLARFRELWSRRGKGVGALGQEWLKEMDERRYIDAPGVVEEFDQRLEEIEPELAPFALGVLGSALRLDFWYTRAERCIELGLEFADEDLDHSTAGNLHQRMTMIKWDQGKQDAAFTQNGLAFSRYLEADDQTGTARATVDMGILLLKTDFPERSNSILQRALEELPDSETSNRVTALDGLAYNHCQLGNLKEALRLAAQCEDIPVNTLNRAKLTWNQAGIVAKQGDILSATTKLLNARCQLATLSPIDCALITIDLCEIYLEEGKIFEAHAEAQSMVAYIEPLRARSPLAEAAARRLVLAGAQVERLTLAMLEVARKKIRTKLVRE